MRRGFQEEVPQGEDLDTLADHVVLVVTGPTPVKLPLASLGYKGAGARQGSLSDCGWTTKTRTNKEEDEEEKEEEEDEKREAVVFLTPLRRSSSFHPFWC